MKVAILGTGAYGLSLALMLNKNGHDIRMYTKFADECAMLKGKRENTQRLPGVKMPNNIYFTTDMAECLAESEVIFITVPAGFVDDISRTLVNYYNDQYICIGSKGIEQDTCLFVDDVVQKYIKTDKISVISGPSFAVDIAQNVPIGLTLASKDAKTRSVVKKTLANETLKIRTCDDVVGVEICGAIKNIIAIACGIIEGRELPESTKAMLITEAMHDIKELIDTLGGDKKTILSYAGIGDLILTCTSTKSRNFSFGRMIGRRASRAEVTQYLSEVTVEGYYTLKSIYSLLRHRQVSMPIIDLIYDIIVHEEDITRLEEFLIKKD